jgi:hypothetical protein
MFYLIVLKFRLFAELLLWNRRCWGSKKRTYQTADGAGRRLAVAEKLLELQLAHVIHEVFVLALRASGLAAGTPSEFVVGAGMAGF